MRKSLFAVLPGVLSLFTAMFVPSLSHADDVPKMAKASQQELEALWSDLYVDDPAAANAVIKLYKIPSAAVPFLKEKLQPLKLDPAQCRRLLLGLGSENEKVWKTAWEKLDYLDPRLAIDLKTLMDEVIDLRVRTRMVEICSQRKVDSLIGKDVILRSAGDGYNFFDGRGSWWAEDRVERIGAKSWDRKTAWTRAARAVAILEQIGTAEAISVLKQLGEGHPEAFPTKAAKDSLKRLQK